MRQGQQEEYQEAQELVTTFQNSPTTQPQEDEDFFDAADMDEEEAAINADKEVMAINARLQATMQAKRKQIRAKKKKGGGQPPIPPITFRELPLPTLREI